MKNLAIDRLIKEQFAEFPDARTGKNAQYEIADAGLGAFSVFFTQCASFLEYQEEMRRLKGRSNAENLFHLGEIPNDNQIQNLLDAVSPKHVAPAYQQVFMALEQAKQFENWMVR